MTGGRGYGNPKIFCESGPGLVLSVTRILRATLTKFRVYVCMYACVTRPTPPKPLNQFA